MHEDIILWRTQGLSWNQIATKLKEEYNIEISPQAVYDYYKRNLSKLEERMKGKLKDEYEEKKGHSVEEELIKDIEVLNLAIEVGRKILQKGEVINHPHQYQATVNGIATAIKTKAALLLDFKEDEDPLLKLLLED
ncbi:hypothetical protein ACO3VM_02700 [Methanocaldococcus sp. 10A]